MQSFLFGYFPIMVQRRLVLFLLVFLSSYVGASSATKLVFVPGSETGIRVQKKSGVFSLKTEGEDPQIVFQVSPDATEGNADQTVLAFDYFCPDGIDFLEVFFKKTNQEKWTAPDSIMGPALPKAETWQQYAINLKDQALGKWDSQQRFYRMDFGRTPGRQIQIRNVVLRSPTKAELISSAEKEKKLLEKQNKANLIGDYLQNEDYPAKIETIEVDKSTITITGKIDSSPGNQFFLVEAQPWENVWNNELGEVVYEKPLDVQFKVSIPRVTDSERDRLTSRFAVVSVNGKDRKLASHVAWASDVNAAAERSMPRLRPSNKKGIAAESTDPVFGQDIDDLGITAATINIDLATLVRDGGNEDIVFRHQGRDWRFNGNAVKNLDRQVKFLTDRKIVVSAILLVGKDAEDLVHPAYASAGVYSMVNLTSQEGADAYRAIVAFLAERYSRADKLHGWITHWIIFNEVDYGWVWTNMGEQPMELYMDSYHRALRLAWLEIRRYNPTAEVFISLTHNWDYQPSNPLKQYAPKAMLDQLAAYSTKEGNFRWGVAYHPYPQSLFEPRTWDDSKAIASFSTPYITPRNLEVLDAYLHQDKFLCDGEPRTVLLSEQGFHTPDYSKESIEEKAAAMAYTWAKIGSLQTIESFHYHRWKDHPNEGGLKVGLRTLPSEKHPHGQRKQPAFDVYSALETDQQNQMTDSLLQKVGIQSWGDAQISPTAIKE